MKKIKNLLIGLVVFVVVLLIIALVVLPKLLSTGKIRDYAADKLGQQIGRQVSIEDASFSIFSGIHLRNVSIANDPSYSARSMIKIKDMVLAYKLWPLIIKQKVVVNDIGMDGLDVLYEMKGRSNNFASLSSNPPKPKAPKVKTDMKDIKEIDLTVKSPIDINVKRVFLTNSNVEFINHNNASKKMLIENINFEVSNLSTDLKYNPGKIKSSIRLVADGSKTNIDFSGKLTDFNAADLELKIDKIVLDKLLSPFVKEAASDKKSSDKSKTAGQALDVDFTFLKNIDLNFVFTLKEFKNKNIKASDIKSKVSLKKLKLLFEAEAKLYNGTADISIDGLLANPKPEFHSKVAIHNVDGQVFLVDSFDIENFIEGKLSVEADVTGEVRLPKKVSGFANCTFTDGKFISGKILGDVGQLFKGIEGKGFKEFFIGLKMAEGAPQLGSVRAVGDGFSIDQSVDLSKSVSDIADKAIAEKKAEIDQAVEAKKEEVVKEAEAVVEEKQEEVKNQLEDQIKGQLGL
jgi:uncharacterized protein involved in outer membrane biogenesis